MTSLKKKAVTIPQKDIDDLESFTREKKACQLMPTQLMTC